MKKSILLVCALLMLLAACSSQASDKVYTTHSCSYVIPSSWESGLSTEDTGMYSSEEDMEAINVSFGDYSLADHLEDYDTEMVTVDDEDVYLFKYQQEDAYYRAFQVTRNEETYTFTIISQAEEPPYYDDFISSIKLNV